MLRVLFALEVVLVCCVSCGGATARPAIDPIPPPATTPSSPPAITKLAALPANDGAWYQLVRYDAASARLVVSWTIGTFLAERAGAYFVDPATGAVTRWDVDEDVAAVAASRVGVSQRMVEAPFEAAIARWSHEIVGQPDTILGTEYPTGESQVVRRDADGTHPVVLDRDSFDSRRVQRAPNGQISWAAYSRRLHGHVLVIAPDDTNTTAPRYFADVPSPRATSWTADGETVYALAREELGHVVVSTGGLLPGERACLVRVTVETGAVVPIRCALGRDHTSVAFDAARTRAAIITRRGYWSADLELVDLESDATIARASGMSIGALFADAIVDGRGRVIGQSPRGGLAVVDVAAGKSWVVDDGFSYLAISETNWLPDGRLAVRRWIMGDAAYHRATVNEIVAIDVDAIVAGTPVDRVIPPRGTPDPGLPSFGTGDRFWESPKACPRGTTLGTRDTPAGVEHWCADRRGTRSGPFVIERGDLPVMRGRYASGQRDGTWTWWVDGHARLEMQLVRGTQHGVLQGWWPNGVREFRVMMKRGHADGLLETASENGTRAIAGIYLAGREHGMWREWHADGHLNLEREFDHGRLVGMSRAFWPSGVVRSETEWLADGHVSRERDAAGRLETERRYEHDRERSYTRYGTTGDIEQITTYLTDRDYTTRLYDPSGNVVFEECTRGETRTRGPCPP